MKCRQATRLVSEGQDRELGLRERAGLQVHLAGCVNCRRFAQQVGVLRLAARRLANLQAPDIEKGPAEDGGDVG